MRRPILFHLALVVLFAFTARPLVAQDWAKAALEKSPRHREYVAIRHGDRTVQAFVVYPQVSQKAPVVFMVHEIFGLSDWAKEMADELAAQGFIVVAPDLLSGFGPNGGGPNGGGTDAFPSQDAVTKAVSGLDPAVVTADLDAAADYGKRLPSANGSLFVGASAGAEASPSTSPPTATISPPPSSSTARRPPTTRSRTSPRPSMASTAATTRASPPPFPPPPPP